MASRLIIEQEPLKVGQVRKVTSNNGEKIDSITLLLNNNVEILFNGIVYVIAVLK